MGEIKPNMKNDTLLLLGCAAAAGYFFLSSKPAAGAVSQGWTVAASPTTAPFSIAAPIATAAANAEAAAINTQVSDFMNDVSTGINTPGGLLGQGSLTDIGYQINQIFGAWF